MNQLPQTLAQPVEVVLHGASQTTCVSTCWGADPDTLWDCICSCAGRYHGTGSGPSKQVNAELAVETDYTTHTFTLRP